MEEPISSPNLNPWNFLSSYHIQCVLYTHTHTHNIIPHRLNIVIILITIVIEILPEFSVIVVGLAHSTSAQQNRDGDV